MKNAILSLFILLNLPIFAQNFYFGADLSYVNEMEDCGAVYQDSSIAKDPYQIFANHGCNLTRLRLWHTPSFYDTLNQGKRYSDLADVRKSILRAKSQGMEVLLDFHLSDFWADPQRQLVPVAWEPVVNNLPLLQDSLYNYVYNTLMQLHQDGLLPEMVQIGNETNKGIMLSPAVDAAGWSLDWPRNSALFKKAIKAVRDVEAATGSTIKVALHAAGPADTGWLMAAFWSNGVTDFDVIGMSYYWAWHKPTTIAQTGNVITQLKQTYPGKEVMIFETGYIWTLQNNDQAANIISETQAGYSPASPENQKKWLVDLTKKVIEKGGAGVIYWEPAWVSTPCFTPWGQGSHQDHATFFDFNNNVLPTGGMYWMSENYGLSATNAPQNANSRLKAWKDSTQNTLFIQKEGLKLKAGEDLKISFYSTDGKKLCADKMVADFNNATSLITMPIPFLVADKVFCVVLQQSGKNLGASLVN
jgi:arabinogalactan endo-1,4-beta-galactosidase